MNKSHRGTILIAAGTLAGLACSLAGLPVVVVLLCVLCVLWGMALDGD